MSACLVQRQRVVQLDMLDVTQVYVRRDPDGRDGSHRKHASILRYIDTGYLHDTTRHGHASVAVSCLRMLSEGF